MRQAGEERQLCAQWRLNYINGTLLTDDAAKKTDINIFEEDTRGANGDMTVSLVCALSMFYQDCATGALRRIVCVSFLRADSYSNKLPPKENIS